MRIELTRLKNKKSKTKLNKSIKIDELLDDVLYQIFLQSNDSDIIEMCSVNQQHKRVCDNDTLWKQLLDRDFPFLLKKLNCDIKTLLKYNTYKKLYELIHFIVNHTFEKILSYFEKRRKSRYPITVQQELYQIILFLINHSLHPNFYDIDPTTINQILIVLNPPKKKDGSFYSMYKIVTNNLLSFLSNDLFTIECNNIDKTDLTKLR